MSAKSSGKLGEKCCKPFIISPTIYDFPKSGRGNTNVLTAGCRNPAAILFALAKTGRIFWRLMLPTLSAENRLKRKLLDLDCSAGFLAALDSSISDSRLSQALRGIKQLENRDAERLLELCDRCIELRDSLEPIPVSFAEPTKIRVVLNNLAVSHEEIQRTIASLFVECK